MKNRVSGPDDKKLKIKSCWQHNVWIWEKVKMKQNDTPLTIYIGGYNVMDGITADYIRGKDVV